MANSTVITVRSQPQFGQPDQRSGFVLFGSGTGRSGTAILAVIRGWTPVPPLFLTLSYPPTEIDLFADNKK